MPTVVTERGTILTLAFGSKKNSFLAMVFSIRSYPDVSGQNLILALQTLKVGELRNGPDTYTPRDHS